MAKLVSSWYNTVESLPKEYVHPLDTRPGEAIIPLSKSIPLIDLGLNDVHGRGAAIQRILQASQEFGFFQVINHGISKDLIDDTMEIYKEFFNMDNEYEASMSPDDPSKSSSLYTSSYDYANEEVHYWRDNLKHPCNPIEETLHLWPEKPTRYREIVGKYTSEVKKLSARILEMICGGLGLEPGYFGDELTAYHLLSINHLPPCPEPSLTLGLPKHADPNLITIIFQGDVYGLQVLKDGQWLGVEPIPHAFVINIGHQLHVISNGKLKAAEHRTVTNLKDPRTSIAYFINPRVDSIIEPAKALTNKCNPPLYRAFQYKEFVEVYKATKEYAYGVLKNFMVIDEE